MGFWDVKKPTTQMRQLCKSLGDQYRITIIDLERVINRDFGNGYDVPREDIGKVVDALYDKYGPNSAGCGTESSVAAAAE